MKILTASLALVLALATQSATRAGSNDLPGQLQAGDHRLVLNGEGVRTKTLLQLYVAGLYLPRPNNNPVEIISADEPMAIRIKITSGFVSQDALVSSLEEGFQKAMNGQTAGLQPRISQFRDCLTDPISKDDTIDLVYVPQRGVIVNKNGKFKGLVAGVDFKQALFGIWLSENPADNRLKQAMLTSKTAR
jgi:hypothetical protein